MRILVAIIALSMVWVDTFLASGFGNDMIYHAGIMMMIVLMVEGFVKQSIWYTAVYAVCMDVIYAHIPFGIFIALCAITWIIVRIFLDIFLGNTKRIQIALAVAIGVLYTIVLHGVLSMVYAITISRDVTLLSSIGFIGIIGIALADALCMRILTSVLQSIRALFKHILIIRPE